MKGCIQSKKRHLLKSVLQPIRQKVGWSLLGPTSISLWKLMLAILLFLFLVMLETQYLLVSVMPYFVIICGVILYQLYSLIIFIIIVFNSHIKVYHANESQELFICVISFRNSVARNKHEN